LAATISSNTSTSSDVDRVNAVLNAVPSLEDDLAFTTLSSPLPSVQATTTLELSSQVTAGDKAFSGPLN
jgi:hypothetical protein